MSFIQRKQKDSSPSVPNTTFCSSQFILATCFSVQVMLPSGCYLPLELYAIVIKMGKNVSNEVWFNLMSVCLKSLNRFFVLKTSRQTLGCCFLPDYCDLRMRSKEPLVTIFLHSSTSLSVHVRQAKNPKTMSI